MNSTMNSTTNSTTTAAALEAALAHFTGSCEYTNHLGLLCTDGVQFLAEHAGAYWLLDAIASHQSPALDRKTGGFQLWTLVRTAEGGAVLECRDDSNRPALVRQEIEYTDFPLEQIKLYVTGEGRGGRCLMLPREY